MERKYENVYLVTSPDIQVQNLLETMSDLMVGNLYVTEENDWIASDFVCFDPDFRWHLESESIIMDEEKKNLIEIIDGTGSWVFRLLD